MKITFLIPPSVEEKAPDRNFGCNFGVTFQQPVHILYPAAVLEKEGHDVDFIDCPVEGRGEEWCENFIENSDTDIYCFFTVYLAESTDMHWAKEIVESTDSKVIFMGPEPSSHPETFLVDENTLVVRGEPEETIKLLVSKLSKGEDYSDLKGISYLENGEVENNPMRPLLTNEELDELPHPARHLIDDSEKYYNPKLDEKPMATMLTSRNCWGKCKYCIPSAYCFAREIEYKHHEGEKPRVGLRSPEDIAEEFEILKEQGYKSVAIMDDNFVNGAERTKEICRKIKDLNMNWGCLSRADVLQDEEMLREMKEVGCQYVDIGVESFDQEILDYVNKEMSVGDIYNVIFLLKKVGIEPKINILLGTSPMEDKETIEWTLEVLKTLDIEYVSFGVIIPHPETEFYQIVKENDWFATHSGDFERVDPYRQATVDFPNLDHEELQEMVRWCYRKYYLRLSYIWKQLKNIRSFSDLVGKAKAAWNLFR